MVKKGESYTDKYGDKRVCLEDNCVNWIEDKKNNRIDQIIKAKCKEKDFKPDPNFGKKLGKMFSDNKKRGGTVRTIIEEDME